VVLVFVGFMTRQGTPRALPLGITLTLLPVGTTTCLRDSFIQVVPPVPGAPTAGLRAPPPPPPPPQHQLSFDRIFHLCSQTVKGLLRVKEKITTLPMSAAAAAVAQVMAATTLEEEGNSLISIEMEQ